MQSGFASDGKTMLYAIDDRGSSGNLDGCGGSVIWAFDYDSRLGTNEFDARYQAKGGKLTVSQSAGTLWWAALMRE